MPFLLGEVLGFDRSNYGHDVGVKVEPRLVLILEVDPVVQLKTNNAFSCKKAVHPGKFAERILARPKTIT